MMNKEETKEQETKSSVETEKTAQQPKKETLDTDSYKRN